MRPRFSDTERLQRLAEKNMEAGLARIKRWWSKKYNRPPNDMMFVSQTVAELQLEMFEDLLVQREEVIDRLDRTTNTEEREDLRDQLRGINKVFEYDDQGDDDLIDEFEREIAAGRMPDLNKRTAG